MYCSILGSLLLRLGLTFKGSMYELSSRLLWSFFILIALIAFCTNVLLTYIVAATHSLDNGSSDSSSLWTAVFAMSACFWIIFLFIGTFSVYMFAHNLLLLARRGEMESIESTPYSVEESSEGVTLNRMQQKYIYLASKYVGLFLVAAICSVSFAILQRFVVKVYLICTLASIRDFINVLAITLQYEFSKKFYDRYWPGKILQNGCHHMMTNHTKRSISVLKRNTNWSLVESVRTDHDEQFENEHHEEVLMLSSDGLDHRCAVMTED